jgi:signal transduction histidine kinase/ligand-binding sensor domain-containing protein
MTMVKSCGWLFLWLCTLPVWALDPQKAITQLVHTSWTEREGAPSSIWALAQTTDGYLWLGTATGLYRFDGIRFTRFEPAAGEELPDTTIVALCATRDGSLWIVSSSGRIGRLHDGHLKTYSPPDGLGRVYSLAEDSHGVLVAGSATGLASFEDRHWKDAGKERGIPAKPVKRVFFDAHDTLWVATEDRILCLPAGEKHFQETGEKVGAVLSFAQAPDGAIWVAETTRSARMIRTGRSHDRGPLTEVAVGASSVLFDRQGSLWISSYGDGLRRIAYPGRVSGQHIAEYGPQAEQFTKKDGLSHDYVMSALEDREGNIWFVTLGGLDRFRESTVTPVSIPDGDQPRCLLASRDGSIWTGGPNRTLQQIGPDGIPKVRADIDWVYYPAALFEDRAGSLWLANMNPVGQGVGRVVGNSIEYLHLPKGVVLHQTWSITMDHAGGLWLLDWDKGVFRFANGVLTSFADVAGLPHQPRGVTYTDRSGRVWFGYQDGRATVYEHGHFHSFGAKDGLAIGRIESIVDDRANRVWLGGEGLCRFQNGRFQCLSRQAGLPMARVAGIAEDEDGFLWVGGNTGVVRIHPDAFDHAVADPAHRVSYDSYNFLDGLPGGLQVGTPYPKVVRGRDGRIWFATTKGLAFIDPRRIPKNSLPPPVHVETLKVDGKTIPRAERVALAPHAHNIEVDYTALSLSIPERVLFRYKLEGADSDWQEAGTRRQAFYTNLLPGQHQFRVIASNNDGVWNETGASWVFSIAPTFYETLWFRTLMALAGIGLIWLLYRLRLQRITARADLRHAERLEERTRIARELHDTLLQGFQGLMLRLQVVDEMLPPGKAKQELEETLETGDQAIVEARNAVHDLRPPTATMNDLAGALHALAQELATGHSANIRLVVEGPRRELHPTIRDEIYRIAREALRNAFAHSGAGHIEAQITFGERLFRLRIRDDGAGIPPEVVDGGRSGHFGLAGMRERAKQIGSQLTISSGPEAGTEIELSVKGSIAYNKTSGTPGWRLFRRKIG